MLTNFFTKLASIVGFQYNIPVNANVDNFLDDTKFERNIEHVKGHFFSFYQYSLFLISDINLLQTLNNNPVHLVDDKGKL